MKQPHDISVDAVLTVYHDLLCYTCICRYQNNTVKSSMDTILSIQPKDSAGGEGETRESVVYKQAGEMLEKLPSDYIPHEVRARLNKMGAIAPMNIFLRQEIDRMQRVVAAVRSTLQDLQLAIDGTIIMSEVTYFYQFVLGNIMFSLITMHVLQM